MNAGILANNGADLTLNDVTVTTDGAHANGVFSYGSGTSLTITDSTITTTGNNSGGLMTTGGASLTASNVTIDTSGNSSAAIRTDRGGGTVTADNITGTTGGVGSPAIYSTADITVADSTLTAGTSEAVVIEGGNSVTITNSDLTGNNSKLNGQSTVATNVLIYQSMSGDASEGNSEFTMTGGSLTSKTGCMFHVTNVTTTINLTDVALTYASDSDDFLVLSADSWGTSGKNGGNATVNLTDQEATGNITVDSVSGLVLNLIDGSTYTGAINSSNSSSSVSVRLTEGSTWKLTGDSYITSFRGDISAIDLNGYTLYINGTAYN
ncbi:MAG: right-handed parallel beta-helix repeat-containing protein [Lachnospiraceae bacterium]|nr:right-handed parallel beta-helix repeat-containing protein [Lachnospiraceae bacterium]